MKKVAIVNGNIIENVIVIGDDSDPASFGGVLLPNGKWIGDRIDDRPTTDERVDTLEEENTLLKAQVSAQSDQMDFYEDCIAEMAAVVYA